MPSEKMAKAFRFSARRGTPRGKVRVGRSHVWTELTGWQNVDVPPVQKAWLGEVVEDARTILSRLRHSHGAGVRP